MRSLTLLFVLIASCALAAAFPNDLPDIDETPPYPDIDTPSTPAPEPSAAAGGGGDAFGGNFTAPVAPDEEDQETAEAGAAEAGTPAADGTDNPLPAAEDELKHAAVSEAATAATFGVWLVIFILLVAIAGVVFWLRTKKNPLEHIK